MQQMIRPQNAGMPTQEEKAAFAQRLILALRRSPEPVQGATELALRFNLRHPGAAVSAQTAHKWLSGRAIPTSDKLATLAKWLNVNEHWLHYGPAPGAIPHAGEQRQAYHAPPSKGVRKAATEATALVQKIQALSPHRRYLVEELVEQLLQNQ
jgi:transcriptional regulator with XRE-family HTH domain